jgi:L-asparagine transporter-like permease
MTARHLVKGCSVIPGETQNPQQNSRKSTAKVVFGLTVVFLISYVPLHIYNTYYYSINNLDIYLSVFSEQKLDPLLFEIFAILEILLSFNSCLNPVALFCTSRAFRRQLKRYLTCCRKTNSPPTDFELRRRN